MSPLRVIAPLTLVGALFAVGVAVGACSKSNNPPPGDALDAGNVDTGSELPPDGSYVDRPPIPSGYDGGVGIGLVDVPDTPCSARGGALVPLVPDAGVPAFITLAKTGSRWVAETIDRSGFITFDESGANVTSVLGNPPSDGRVVAIGGGVTLAGASSTTADVVAQAFDPVTGKTSGPELAVAKEEGENVGAGAGDGGALVVWGGPNGLRARGIANGAAAGAGAFDLAITSRTNALTMGIAPGENDLYAVVFSGDDTSTSVQTAFGRGTATARVGDPTNLFTGKTPRHVLALARMPAGYALLLGVNHGAETYAMLVLLDTGGRPITAGMKLLGTVDGSSLAVNGAEVGVLAHRKEVQGSNILHAIEFRSFDANGATLGPWVCLEAPAVGGDLGGALAADGTGYSAVFRTHAGVTSLARFDRLGTGAP